MRHFIPLVIAIALLALGANVAWHDHRAYVEKMTAQAKATAQQQLASYQAAQDKYNKLEAACHDGLNAYNLLTPAQIQKAKLTKPACD